MTDEIKAALDSEESFFKRSGVKVIVASSNEEALALHKTHKADLIIASLDSAGMSGEILCSLIRDDVELRRVSIIIVGPDNETVLDRFLKCRANAFVTMPLNSAVLLEEAHQLLHIAPRTACRISISVKLNGTSKKAPLIGFLENISPSGLLFRAASNLHEGDMVKCSFSLPGYKHISTEAQIVRKTAVQETQPPANHYGAIFTDIGSDSLLAIETFVKKTSCK